MVQTIDPRIIALQTIDSWNNLALTIGPWIIVVYTMGPGLLYGDRPELWKVSLELFYTQNCKNVRNSSIF